MSQLDLPPGGLTGRVAELDFLQGFFGQAAVSGGALLLTGDPGVGKTALLNALADAAAAAGTTVLRVAGVEFEGDVSFSGLNLALLPLLGDFDGLGAAHRDALRVALGFGAGPAPDRLLVSNAALARLTPAPPPLLALNIDLFADPARTGAAALPRLEAALRTVHREVDPNVIENIAGSAMYADRLAEVREPLWRSVLRGREGGLGRRHLVALMDLWTDDFHRGEWGEAAELAAEGLRVSEERGGRFFGWYFRYHQALLAAVQGRFDTSRALASQIIGWAGPRGVRTAQVFAHQPLVLADLGQGDSPGR